MEDEQSDTGSPDATDDDRRINDALQRQLAKPSSDATAPKTTRGLSPTEGRALTQTLERAISRAMGRR